MKKILPLLILLFVLSACENNEPDGPVIHEKVNKTVLVYMAANNSLGGNSNSNFDERDIAEMLEGVKNTNSIGNLILYTVNQRERKPYLIDIRKTGTGAKLDTLKSYDLGRNSLSVENMKEVFDYVFEFYPADEYGICFWSHADGWLPAPDTDVQTRFFGQDGSNYMNISDLAKVLETAPHFDFIFFDACFMQAASVAYELRGYADYIIGSATEIPGTGAPYQSVVAPMFQASNSAYGIASAYYNHYEQNYDANYSSSYYTGEWPYGACVSAIKCSEMEGLASETAKILGNHSDDIINLKISDIQSYDCRSYPKAYYDLKDMMNKVATDAEKAVWEAQLAKTVIFENSTPTCLSAINGIRRFSVDVHGGMATYIPVFNNPKYTRWNAYYKTFQWYTAAGWDKVYEAGEE